MKIIFTVSIMLIISTFAQAEEAILPEVVITSSKTERLYNSVASATTVITEEDIKQSGKNTVADILRTVPSLDVVQSGALGGNTSVFIRGANSEHTLVVLDGIELNNPSNTSRGFNFANLSVVNIERIEIIRGPQASIYGSDAIGGVINIITKEAANTQSSLTFEGGSFQTFREQAGINIAEDSFNLSLEALRIDSENVSAAEGGTEDDEYSNTEVALKTGYKIDNNSKASFILRYQDSDSDIDDFGGEFGDDTNRKLENQKLFLRGQTEFAFLDNVWQQKLGVSHSDHRLKDRDDADPVHALDFNRSDFNGELFKIDWLHQINLFEDVDILFGLETEKEKIDNSTRSISSFGEFTSELKDRDARTNGYFLEVLFEPIENASISSSVRIDDHSQFGSNLTYRIAPAYYIESSATKLAATFGTAFKAPSLFQLYSDFGNANLDPEESEGWDVTIEQELLSELIAGITYFQNDIDDLINFDNATFVFANIGEVETSGFESFLKWKVTEDLLLSLAYSYTDTEDADGASLLRRSRNKLATQINWSYGKFNITSDFSLVGKRYDLDFSTFPSERVSLPSYLLANLSARYELNEEISLFTRIENIFDREYQDVLGFNTRGFGVYAGVNVKLDFVS